jgi:putative PIN family toxin of toxin-antitoxin system
MVFLQAATSDRGPAFACLELVESGEIALYVSPAVLDEIRDVLSRPKIQAKFPHLTAERIDVFLQKVATMATIVHEIPDAGLPVRDLDDLPYLNLAIATGVEYIVTRDKDLLELIKAPAFRARCPQMRITEPVAFLAEVRAGRSSP